MFTLKSVVASVPLSLAYCFPWGFMLNCYRKDWFSCPWAYDVMSQYLHKVQSPCAEHVVRGGEVLLREGPGAYLVITPLRSSVSAHQFRVHWWYWSVDGTNTYHVCNLNGVLDGGPGGYHDK